MDIEERRALVGLSLVPGLGPGRIRKLLRRRGTALDVFKSNTSILSDVPGISRRIALSIISFNQFDLVDAQFRAAHRIGARLLTESDPAYPTLLKEIYDPPTFLWIRGEMTEQDNQAVAIVGTRRATSYGRHIAGALAGGLVECGITVVSGLAYGIDTAAHRGAIDAGGRSIGVLGSGVDRIYPGSNRALARRMIQSGCLLSEYALGAQPDAPNFPRRNRIISGMTLGTVIVEAFEEGGALITARLACEQNREVFAVPSPISRRDGPGSGCNRLIHNRLIQRSHAKLIMSVEDIISEIRQLQHTESVSKARVEEPDSLPDSLSDEEQILWHALEYQPIHLDAICTKCELDPSTALVNLLNLEFKGLVRQMAGNQFVRN